MVTVQMMVPVFVKKDGEEMPVTVSANQAITSGFLNLMNYFGLLESIIGIFKDFEAPKIQIKICKKPQNKP